ncbi:hypothetical protein HGA91_05160 [candidate division WWE3 bacterium]|nr:hypothetical protein [candidate division WWE3 bacterium]
MLGGDFSKGAVLGAATMLPATAGTLALSGQSNTLLVSALITLSSVMLLVTVAMIVRYAINNRRHQG